MVILKHKFHCHKNLIFLEDVDIKKIQVSHTVPLGEENDKYFFGCKDDDHKIKPLRIMFPKTSTYWQSNDGEDGELLKKYNGIWYSVRYSVK